MYSNGTITNLGSFLAEATNDNGVMAGGGPSIDSVTVQNLNMLIPARSPCHVQNATAVHGIGRIVVNAASTPTSQTHALLLIRA